MGPQSSGMSRDHFPFRYVYIFSVSGLIPYHTIVPARTDDLFGGASHRFVKRRGFLAVHGLQQLGLLDQPEGGR